MKFGEVLEGIKTRHHYTRLGWDNKGEFIRYMGATKDLSGDIAYADCLVFIDEDNVIHSGWLPSLQDLMAEDWIIIEPEF